MPEDYSDLYATAGKQYGVDPLLAQAMAQQESQEDPEAFSSKGAGGVMQLMPNTATALGVRDVTDPNQNIPAGVKYFSQMRQKYNDSNLALIAYNYGPGNTDKWIKNGAKVEELPDETKDYVGKVTGNYRKLKIPAETKTVAGSVTPAAYTTTAPAQDPNLISTDEKNLPAMPNTASDDPFEAAKRELAAEKAAAAGSTTSPTAATSSISDDPFEAAKRELATESAQKKQEIAQNPPKPVFGNSAVDSIEDMVLAAPSGIIKGTNNLLKAPGGAYNLGSRIGASLGNIAHDYMHPDEAFTPDQKVANIRNAGQDKFGNALNSAPTLSQIPALLMNPFMDNNLTYKDIVSEPGIPTTGYAPHTAAGDAVANLTSAVPGGGLSGFRPLASMGAAGASDLVSKTVPDSPILETAAGALGGLVPAGIRAANFRSLPPEIANNIIQNSKNPPGGGTGGPKNPLVPQNMDLSEIVPGSKPTLAEATKDPNLSVLERQRQMQDPSTFGAHEATRESARKQYFEKASGTPQDVEALRTERETKSTPLYDQAAQQPLNPDAVKPVLAKIDAAIDQVGDGSEAGKTLAKIRAKITGALPTTTTQTKGLLDPQGNPIATPKAKNTTQSPLVQIYREERDNLQKPATADGAYAATVKSVIQPIVSDLGGAIESQSPTFAKAQQIYRDISPKIDAAEWMQGLKLTDAAGRFTLAKVKNALENAQRLKNSPGLNSAKNLTKDQMETLQNLHDDLLRRESVARASMPRNSTTVQNAIMSNALNSGLAGKVNKLTGGNFPATAGTAAGSLLGGSVGFPMLGSMLGEVAGKKVGNAMTGKSAAAIENLQHFMLNPADYKQYLASQLNNTFVKRLKGNVLTNP